MSEATDLAKRAVELLYEEDQDFVEGGCADVSEVIAGLLKRRGHKAEVVYGWARKGARGEPFMHAWLVVEGEQVDPVLSVQGKDLRRYLYKVEPGTKIALECPVDLSDYIDDLDRRL